MSGKTLELLGAVKTVRAIRDVVYNGAEYRGRKRERVDGQNGSYEIIETHPGDVFECDAGFAKRAENAGEIVLLSGGRVDVVPQADGFPIYRSWIRNISDPDPAFEKCELLRPMSFGDGCLLEPGTKLRLDTTTFWERSRFCYADEPLTDQHAVRVLRASPVRVKSDAAELSSRVGVMWKKLYGDTPANA